MRTQNGRRGYCAKFIQLIQSVWAESRASTLYNIWHWRVNFQFEYLREKSPKFEMAISNGARRGYLVKLRI